MKPRSCKNYLRRSLNNGAVFLFVLPLMGFSPALTVGAATSTLWPPGAVPGLVDSGPDSAVELGVEFRSDVAGAISGIRFYKAATNTGTHACQHRDPSRELVE